jgi:hypothetical protein
MLDTDLELRITLEDDRELAFELNSSVAGLGYYRSPMGRVRLSAAPRQHLDLLFGELSQLSRQRAERYSALEQSEISAQIAGVGQRLYRDLFPEELKRAYRQLRRQRAERPLSLLISSDEPWIPWELVKPFERVAETGELIDDPFFCEQFALTRWLAGWPLVDRLEIAAVALVSPASDLAFVQRERSYIAGLAERAPQTQVLPPIGSASAVRAQLSAGIAQLWHLACHGSFNSDTPDRSALRLDGGDLRAEEIVGPVELGVAQSRPLVMLNACHTGRQDFALTGLGGWAQQLVRAGASGFIGTQWEANDALAAEFAVALYEALWLGQPLGQAAHAARQAIKRQDATNPTWLSYAVYGHPGLRTWLSSQIAPQPELSPQPQPRPLPPDHSSPSVSNTATTRSLDPATIAVLTPTPPPDDFRYDAFVSYRDEEPDRGWVRNQLVPALDAAGLRICLDVRDFDPGVPALDEMARAIEQSRRTIAVLSNGYVAGNFEEVQSVMAQTLGIEAGQYRLLPVRFQRDAQLPLRIRMLWPLDLADLQRQPQALHKLIAAIRTLPARR